MSLSIKRKQSHRHETDLWLPEGKECREGWMGSLGLTNTKLLRV